jgi:dTDP-4-dehydrorhamnose 3,5-epimerase
MRLSPLPLAGAFIIEREAITDQRGFFERMFCRNDYQAATGFAYKIVQINHTLTKLTGSIRGMHFQFPPKAESKIVQCLHGRIFDVIIDIRHSSPTFLRWYGETLSSENRKGFVIPEGFAHGFQTLCTDCELIYFHSAFYDKSSEGGILYNDPLINIAWPIEPSHISDRDTHHPPLTPTFAGV